MSETSALLDRLRRHYIKPGEPFPGGVFLHETGWNGAHHTTRCDALYVGFTSTRGRLLTGHEIKVSRSDWLHELDQPHKADPWCDQCHAWYVVAPVEGIVRPEELPHGWGLMLPEPRSKVRMRIAVPAQLHTERTPSWDACRSILARYDTLRAQAISDATFAARREAQEQVEQRVEALVACGPPATDETRARDVLTALELAIGRKLTGYRGWGPDHVGVEELAALMPLIDPARDIEDARRQLTGNLRTDAARAALDRLDQALTEIA